MTGHDDRTIMSRTPDMMVSQTGCSDIMSVGSELRKQQIIDVLDIMSASISGHTSRARDLRKRRSCPGSVRSVDIMSDPTSAVTICSGRRVP